MDYSKLEWRKSSRSNPSGNCLEAATLPDGGVAIRNSNRLELGVITYTRAEWDAFIGGVKDGDFAGI